MNNFSVKNISIVVPIFNEEESIEILVQTIVSVCDEHNILFELILVDDGSTDRSWQKISTLCHRNKKIRGIRFRKNYGQTSAMVAGFNHASGDIIVTMDGDLQNDPKDIVTLLDKLYEGYEVVSGWRKNRRDHFSRVLPSRIANFIISMTTGVRLHDYGCSLKAYRSECIRAIDAYGEMHRFFPAIASMTGARVTEIPVNHFERKYGKSKYGFDRIIKVFFDIFSMNLIIRFSSMPLKGFSLCSIPFWLLTFFLFLVSIIANVFSWSPGKSTFFLFSSALSCMSAIHLIILGILAELIVGTSDLKHTKFHEITMEKFCPMENKGIFVNRNQL